MAGAPRCLQDGEGSRLSRRRYSCALQRPPRVGTNLAKPETLQEGVRSRNGKNRTLRPSKDHSTKRPVGLAKMRRIGGIPTKVRKTPRNCRD